MVPLLAWALLFKGSGYAEQGRLREGIALIRAAEDLARSQGMGDVLIQALLAAGFHLGEIDQGAALESFREGLALARRLGNRPQARLLVNNIGYTAFIAGDWELALAELEGTLQDELEPGERVFVAGNVLNIRACRGEDVDPQLAELDALAEASKDSVHRLPGMEVRGLAAFSKGDHNVARQHYRTTAELAPSQAVSSLYDAGLQALMGQDLEAARADLAALDETGVHGRVAELRRLTLRAGIAGLEGRSDEATASFREALRDWQEGRMRWEEAKAGLAMAAVLGASSREVGAVIEATRSILEAVKARPLIDLLDGFVAQSAPASTVGDRTPEAVRT